MEEIDTQCRTGPKIIMAKKLLRSRQQYFHLHFCQRGLCTQLGVVAFLGFSCLVDLNFYYLYGADELSLLSIRIFLRCEFLDAPGALTGQQSFFTYRALGTIACPDKLCRNVSRH